MMYETFYSIFRSPRDIWADIPSRRFRRSTAYWEAHTFLPPIKLKDVLPRFTASRGGITFYKPPEMMW